MLYFAYGSNMSSQRLNAQDRLAGAAHSLGLARTQEKFELEFTVWSRGNECAAATLTPGFGRTIWGVLYDVPDHLIARETSGDRRSLDGIEGEGTNYERLPVTLMHRDGSPVDKDVITYLAKRAVPNLKTSSHYINHIICGLREHKAPEEYVTYVKIQIAKNNPALREQINGGNQG